MGEARKGEMLLRGGEVRIEEVRIGEAPKGAAQRGKTPGGEMKRGHVQMEEAQMEETPKGQVQMGAVLKGAVLKGAVLKGGVMAGEGTKGGVEELSMVSSVGHLSTVDLSQVGALSRVCDLWLAHRRRGCPFLRLPCCRLGVKGFLY